MSDWADDKAASLLQNWETADPDGADHEELKNLICDYLRATRRQARANALEEAAKAAVNYGRRMKRIGTTPGEKRQRELDAFVSACTEVSHVILSIKDKT